MATFLLLMLLLLPIILLPLSSSSSSSSSSPSPSSSPSSSSSSSSSSSTALSSLGTARLNAANASISSTTCNSEEEYFHFFVHDILNASEAGVNASAYLVAGPVEELSPYGAIIVFDDKVTEGPSYDSVEIGRARGTYTVDNLPGTGNQHQTLLYQFTVEIYGRGKLCFFGQRLLTSPDELVVFACGGSFRHGMSIATIAAIFFSQSGLNEIFSVDLRI